MIKAILLIGVLVAVLMVGGVLEVRIHLDRIADVPGALIAFVSKPTTQAKARVLYTNIKRKGEQLIVRDEEKKTKLALLYVKQDSARLQEMVGTAESEALLPQAQLLADSMARVKTQLETVSLDTLGALKDDSREALAAAEETLKQLDHERERYTAVQEKFSSITVAIENSLSELKSTQPDNPLPTPSPSGETQSGTPLTF